jgi:hypothetical protein
MGGMREQAQTIGGRVAYPPNMTLLTTTWRVFGLSSNMIPTCRDSSDRDHTDATRRLKESRDRPLHIRTRTRGRTHEGGPELTVVGLSELELVRTSMLAAACFCRAETRWSSPTRPCVRWTRAIARSRTAAAGDMQPVILSSRPTSSGAGNSKDARLLHCVRRTV